MSKKTFRPLQKFLLPFKWKNQESRLKKKMQLVDKQILLDTIKQKQDEHHQSIRKNDVKNQYKSEGFIEAIHFVCQELSEYKT